MIIIVLQENNMAYLESGFDSISYGWDFLSLMFY